ncbi:MAG: carboxypeptidase-like regulatory domain-containing protein [Bacteroidetes bacterium]|nr:carboxypeptidase-like regulatory domain-containing protein [Bacteroidota bacterium]
MIIFIRKNQLAFLLALISIVIPSFGSAQNSIEGTISSSDNQPVIGAIVRLDSTFLVTTSDDKGHFLFSGLKKNEYSLSVSHIAFETKNLTVKNGSNTAVTLDAKSYLSDEVNITATRVDSKNGSAFTNISKDEIRSGNLGQDIPYLINNQPSVVVTSDAGTGIGYSGIRLRGNDATRLNVTLNGIPVNDAESHQVYWVDLPDLASSIDNIQLQRGLGSSSNGAGAWRKLKHSDYLIFRKAIRRSLFFSRIIQYI